MSKNHKYFELKREHIALITNLLTTPEKLSLIGSSNTPLSPFSDNNLMDDLGDLLVGRELTDEEKKDLESKGIEYASRDNVDFLKQIYSELPEALDVILNTQSFEPGKYRTRWYERNWVKIDD